MARGSCSHWLGRRRGIYVSFYAQMHVEESIAIYQAKTPLEIQVNIDLGEANTRFHGHFMGEEVVDVETCAWIPDIGSSRT
jgi:hypothetical protein